MGSETVSVPVFHRPSVNKCQCQEYTKKEQQQSKDVPARQYVSTTLCHQCGHALKLKLRVRAVDNLEKIRSGHVPESSEYDMICQLIKEGDEDVERYQKEIHALRSTTAKIERDKQALETYLLDLRCMISPIRRVPTEVMTEILRQVCCTVNGESSDKKILLVGNDLRSRRIVDIPILALAKVCSAWRKIIQSTPSLWSHIVLSYSQKTTPPRLVDLFLTRSNPVALHFHLEDASTMQTRSHRLETNTNLHKLLQHASRWGTISLGPNSHPFVGGQILQQLHYTDLPHLVRLDIARDPEAHLYLEDDSPFLLEERTSPLPLRVPNLRSISLDSFSLSIDSPQALSSLRSLELTNIEPRRVMLTLERLPNLTDLSLHECPIQNPVKDTPKVVVDNLRNLFIEWDYSSIEPLEGDILPHEKILKALTLPALECLTLADAAHHNHHHDDDDDDDNDNEENEESGFDVAPLLEMLERSYSHSRTGTGTGMKLKKLGLWTIDMSGEQLLKLLRLECVNELTHLKVKESSCSYTETVTGEVVEALTVMLTRARGRRSEAPVASGAGIGVGAGDDNGTRNSNPADAIQSQPQLQPSTTTSTSTSSTATTVTALLPRLTHLDLVVYPRFSSEDFLGMVMSRTMYTCAQDQDSTSAESSAPASGSGSGSSNVAAGTGTTAPGLSSCTLRLGPSRSISLPLGPSHLKKLRLTRLTGALYDNLRRDLEELGKKEGLEVFFNDPRPHPSPSWKS
ncbi:hypothetical protein D9758_012745 [Tetrapyrgos nigripes]|uniref:F-box domain-containing protein n=1 Tax=Tetrapyrgos nigripes TaxID=182062 RepID=A0A8H5FR06_9AGAR|nr:hypothetical protein D9758_012745 [Tetrapyrgos nigripes]